MAKDDRYLELRGHFETDPDVVVNSGKGAQGIKYNNKMFIMFNKGDLLIKLSPDRIKELIDGGIGKGYDPGTGKIMKDRVLIPHSKKDNWISLCEESKKYVMS
jgi:hypothetical protein